MADRLLLAVENLAKVVTEMSTLQVETNNNLNLLATRINRIERQLGL